MTRRHLLAWVVLIAVLTAGCGVRPSAVITGVSAPTAHAVGPVERTAPPALHPGTVLYFVAGSALTPVIRGTGGPLSPMRILSLLQEGPNQDERAAALTSEVPARLEPITITTHASGDVDVTVSTDVTRLSDMAVDQIVCTVGDALSTTAPVTLTGAGTTRGPRHCPLTA